MNKNRNPRYSGRHSHRGSEPPCPCLSAGSPFGQSFSKVKVAYIGSWFDPPKARRPPWPRSRRGPTLSSPNGSACLDGKRKGVPAFGNMMDQNSLAPEAVITGPVWDMYPTVRHNIDTVRRGTWKADNLKEWSMMAKGGASLAPFPRIREEASPGSDRRGQGDGGKNFGREVRGTGHRDGTHNRLRIKGPVSRPFFS